MNYKYILHLYIINTIYEIYTYMHCSEVNWLPKYNDLPPPPPPPALVIQEEKLAGEVRREKKNILKI